MTIVTLTFSKERNRRFVEMRIPRPWVKVKGKYETADTMPTLEEFLRTVDAEVE